MQVVGSQRGHRRRHRLAMTMLSTTTAIKITIEGEMEGLHTLGRRTTSSRHAT